MPPVVIDLNKGPDPGPPCVIGLNPGPTVVVTCLACGKSVQVRPQAAAELAAAANCRVQDVVFMHADCRIRQLGELMAAAVNGYEAKIEDLEARLRDRPGYDD